MFQAVNKRSVSEEVFDQLCDRIVSQELKAGEELPSERILSELLGVSRNAVREAIKRLQQAGLVQVRHGGVSTVLDYRRKASPDLLANLLFDSKGQVQVDVARSIVRMRQVLSPEVAADAAENGGTNTATQLESIITKMEAAASVAEIQPLALEFWDVLVDGSGNITYRLAFNSLQKTYKPILSLLTNVLSQDLKRIESFKQMARAVREGDSDTARLCARDYIDGSSAAIYQFLDLYEQQAQ